MARDLELGCGDKLSLDAFQAHDHLAVAHEGGVCTLGLVKSDLADAAARCVDVLIELMDAGILNVDNHEVVVDHILEQLDLGKRIVLVALVPAQVVGRDVEQHRHARMKLGGRSNLITRQLSHKPLIVCAAVDLVHRRLTDIADGHAGFTGALSR